MCQVDDCQADLTSAHRWSSPSVGGPPRWRESAKHRWRRATSPSVLVEGTEDREESAVGFEMPALFVRGAKVSSQKINTLELQRLLMVEGNIQFWEDFLGVFSRILMGP
uniref:Uncharacterized protein n=1 Tax=Zea mays TaxID=4577 RepID=C0PMP9_MAIZE|nr:unknown [Zea mays]